MKHFNMASSFHIKCFFHRCSLYQDRHIAIQNIDLLLGIIHHGFGSPDRRYADDDTAQQKEATDDCDESNLIFKVLYYHCFCVYNVIS